jgi:CubicO group peptidase (beta-lactamase class C family)
VGKHLQGWLPPEHEASITIHELLTHTAGLGDYLGQIEHDPAIREASSLDAYRELVRTSTVEAPPENSLRYSNSGYVVLGALIEAVTGRDYFDVVRETIYAPAGMTRTDSWRMDEVVADRATGYIPPDESAATGLGAGWHSNARLRGVRGTSAGGGYSTAGDMLRFARALVEGRLVRRETLDALLEPRVRFPVGGHYAYGFVVHQGRDGRRTFGHAGGFPGTSGELKVYGDGAWTLVVLSNASGGAGAIVGSWDGIAARLAP